MKTKTRKPTPPSADTDTADTLQQMLDDTAHDTSVQQMLDKAAADLARLNEQIKAELRTLDEYQAEAERIAHHADARCTHISDLRILERLQVAAVDEAKQHLDWSEGTAMRQQYVTAHAQASHVLKTTRLEIKALEEQHASESEREAEALARLAGNTSACERMIADLRQHSIDLQERMKRIQDKAIEDDSMDMVLRLELAESDVKAHEHGLAMAHEGRRLMREEAGLMLKKYPQLRNRLLPYLPVEDANIAVMRSALAFMRELLARRLDLADALDIPISARLRHWWDALTVTPDDLYVRDNLRHDPANLREKIADLEQVIREYIVWRQAT